MKYLPALGAVCLLIVPSVASAQQLPGHPNPHGTTVTVTDYNHNWLKPYSNSGTIQINSGAHLANKASIGAHATLTSDTKPRTLLSEPGTSSWGFRTDWGNFRAPAQEC